MRKGSVRPTGGSLTDGGGFHVVEDGITAAKTATSACNSMSPPTRRQGASYPFSVFHFKGPQFKMTMSCDNRNFL